MWLLQYILQKPNHLDLYTQRKIKMKQKYKSNCFVITFYVLSDIWNMVGVIIAAIFHLSRMNAFLEFLEWKCHHRPIYSHVC
jgi:hypothetical protein